MWGDEDGRTESWAHLHPRNASKAHMEQLFLKTNWRLVERLFYIQGSKERSTQSQVGGEEKLSCQEQGTHRGGGESQARGSWLGTEGLKHAPQELESNAGKASPLIWLNQRGVKNWDSANEACLLPGTTAEEVDWKDARLWLVLWPLQCMTRPTLGTCISPSCSGATASSNVTPAATSEVYSKFKMSFSLRGNTSNWKKWLILGLGYIKYK